MKLDTTKVYDLKDLNDKQLRELVEYLRKEHNASIFHHKNFSIIKKHVKNINQLATNKYCKTWGLYPKDYWDRKVINARNLFTQPKNERIAQIQLRIQELNNELIDLDEEMRTLTYEK